MGVVRDDDLPGFNRFYAFGDLGNRLEFLERAQGPSGAQLRGNRDPEQA